MSDDFISDFDPSDPTLGVDFTREELERTIDGYMGFLRDSASAAGDLGEFTSNLTVSLELLPFVSAQDEGIPYDPEEVEARVSAHASEAESLLRDVPKDRRGDPKIIHRLGALTKTPIKEARERAEAQSAQEEKQQRINQIKQQIQAEEAKFAVTAKDRRKQTYIVDGKTKAGPWLVQKASEILDDGSQMQVFRKEESELLSGIALKTLSEPFIEQLRGVLDTIMNHHKAIRRLGGTGADRGLLSAVMSLKEIYESSEASKLRGADVAPLLRLAERLFEQSEATDEMVVDTLYEGPFAHCEVVPVSPFEGSTVIIDEALVTEENIIADIMTAVARSRGNYLVLEERVRDFIKLRQELIEKYGTENIAIFRTLKAKWHPLPWYAIRVNKDGSNKQPYVAVLESPIYGNSSYVLNHDELSWLDMMEFRRRELLRMGGARSFPHHPDSTTAHTQKLSNHIQKEMKK